MSRASSGWRGGVVALAAALLSGLAVAPAAQAVAPPTRSVSWVARVVAPTVVRTGPDQGPVVYIQPPTATWGGGVVRLAVTDVRRSPSGERWVEVILPSRPNGRVGWVRADAVRIGTTPWRVEVRRSTRTVSVYRSGRLARRFRAVIGAPATPTPVGRAAIYEVIQQADPRGFIGPWALHLTAHSDVLDNYGGGPGRVAIHGRDGASFFDPLGTARSHGCVRVNNADINWLAKRAGPGTPVRIRP